MRYVVCAALALLFVSNTAFAEGPVDTTEDVSFGFGLQSSNNSLLSWDNELTIDYWKSNLLAVGGSFALNHASASKGDFSTSQTEMKVGLMVTKVLHAGETTRLTFGGGLGFEYFTSDDGVDATDEGSPIALTIPAALSLEHFFTDTISLGLNARFNAFRLEKDDDGNDDSDDESRTWINFDTTTVGLELTWYTD